MTSLAFTAGETISFSIATVTNDGVGIATFSDSSTSIALFSVVLSDGATGSGQVPAGFTGLRYRNAGASSGFVTGFAFTCTAATAPDTAEDGNDVGSEPGQAATLTTAQVGAEAVTNIAGFVNSAVARRFTAGPLGVPPAVTESARGGGEAGPVQIASLLPVGQLLHGARQALYGNGLDQLAVAGTQIADSVLAAADRPFGLWLNGAATFFDNAKPGGQYGGTVLSLAAGADYQLRLGLFAGLAIGYERGDVDTAFNAGELQSNGFTISPYVGWQPLDELVLDAVGGVTLLDYDITRAGGTVTGSFGATRYFAAVNATGNFRFDALRLSPLAGVLYFRERQEAYTDSAATAVTAQTIALGRLTAGIEAGYRFPLGTELDLEPYVRFAGEWDVIRPGAVTLTTGERFRPGRLGGSIAGGLNLIDAGGLTANLEASYDSIGRAHYDSVTIQGTLRFEF